MIYIYDFFLTLLLIVFSPLLLIITLLNKKWRVGILERFGFFPAGCMDSLSGKKVIWFHAASAGEVQALVPVVREFKMMKPDYILFVTTTSVNGKKKIEKELTSTINCVLLLPIDAGFIVSSVVKRINPAALVIVETELWPNLLFQVSRRHVPVIMINGRISKKSFRLYYVFRLFFSNVLNCFNVLIVQSEKMQIRLRKLGVKNKKIIIMNNTKYSFEIDPIKADKIKKINKNGKKFVVAGSIREGEEQDVIDGFKLANEPTAVLIIAPRHLSRVTVIEKIFQQKNMKYVRWSTFKDYGKIAEFDAVIIDTIGELSYIYTAGDVAIIGGGFKLFGGHNPMEAAAAGLPIIMGEHMFNFEDTADQFQKNGGAFRAKTSAEIGTQVKTLLTNEKLRLSMGDLNRKIVERFRGSASTTAMLIEEILIDNKMK